MFGASFGHVTPYHLGGTKPAYPTVRTLPGDLMSGVVGLRMPLFTAFGDTVARHTVEHVPSIKSKLGLSS